MITESGSTNSSRSRRSRVSGFDLIVLVFILVAGAFLRFYAIGETSLWKDEIWSIEMGMGSGSVHDRLLPGFIRTDQPNLTALAGAAPWWSIWTHVSGVTHPPLYFVLLRWWIDLFGTGAAAIRALSAIASIAGILVLFDICRFLHGPKIAIFAAAIMALSVGQIDFAQDARSYTLLILLALGCIDLLVRIEYLGLSPMRVAALAICCASAALTHYVMAAPLLALGLFAVIHLRRNLRLRALAGLGAGAAVALAVWAPLLSTQTHTLPSLVPTFLQEARVEDHAKLTLYRIIGLPAEFLFGESGGESLARRAPKLVLVIFLLTMVVPILRVYWRRDLLLWVLWMLGAVGSVALMDLLHGTTLAGYPRYTILATPAIFAAIASFDWPRLGVLRDLMAIVFIAALTISAADRVTTTQTPLEDWRGLAAALDANAGPNDLLIFSNPDPWVTPGTWYMGIKYYSPGSHHPWLILDGPADAQLLRRIAGFPGVWLIGDHPENAGPALLPGWHAESVIATSAGSACKMATSESLGTTR